MTLLPLLLAVALLQLLLPHGMRPGLWFSVTTPPGFRHAAPGRHALRRYRAGLLLSALLALGLLARALRLDSVPLAQGGLLLQVLGGLGAHAWARRGVLPHALPEDTVREASLSPRPEGLPGGLALQAGPFLLLAVAALWPLAAREEAPSGASLRTLAHALLTCAALALLALALLRGARRGEPLGRWGSPRRLSLAGVLGGQYLVALCGSAAALGLAGGPAWLPALQPVALGLFLAATAVGVAGALRARATGRAPGDRTPDASWRWGGVLYLNREDPALFVEKRLGIGYTLNFGNRWAWVLLGLLLGLPLASQWLGALPGAR